MAVTSPSAVFRTFPQSIIDAIFEVAENTSDWMLALVCFSSPRLVNSFELQEKLDVYIHFAVGTQLQSETGLVWMAIIYSETSIASLRWETNQLLF